MTIEEMRAKALPAQRSQKKARSLVSSLGGALKGSPGAPSQQFPPQQPAGVPRSPLLFQPPPAANMADAQSALRRRDAGMTIEEMRAKALECTGLYFPDLRWSQPEFQDALAAFFHYILTGAWPPSDHVQMTIGQEGAKKATYTTAPDREFEAADQHRA
jgi:hypothetical protein